MASRSSRRLKKQNLRARYSKVREDAQLAGVIPMTPEGAPRPEKVDPRLQGCQQLPEIVKQALKDNWSTPDAAKPAIVGALLGPFFESTVVLDKDGNRVVIPPDPKLLNELARTLRMLDQTQFARDNPEAAGKARGGTTSVSVQTNAQAAAVIRELLERDKNRSAGAVPSFAEPGALGDSRFAGEVEVGSAPTDGEQRSG